MRNVGPIVAHDIQMYVFDVFADVESHGAEPKVILRYDSAYINSWVDVVSRVPVGGCCFEITWACTRSRISDRSEVLCGIARRNMVHNKHKVAIFERQA